MLAHNLFDFAQFLCAESKVAGERDWIEPELGG